MNDSHFLVKPKRLSTPTPGQLLAARQRPADEFFTHLEPTKVVEALTPPAGVLRGCLAEASAVERDFAMRTAIASQKIWQWLNELNQWNWPKQVGSEGFLEPNNTQRKLFAQAPTPEEEADRKQYMGSLLAEEVEKYETRINQINQDMDDLDLEEIKGHVMNDHILPLSRPGTPMNMDPSRSMLSALSSYHKMEDISVLITAIVVRTLPNLAKLSRLLQLWHMRIIVLRHVNPFLQAIQEVEALLGENWEAISQSHWEMEQPSRKAIVLPARTLTYNDFDARRQSLALKVADPGRTLDYMLDCLEGAPDTLPDAWLNRVEDVEQGYGEWVSACERKMTEAKLAKLAKAKAKATHVRKTSSLSPSPTRTRQSASDRETSTATSIDMRGNKLSPPLLLLPPMGDSDHGAYLDPIAEDELSSSEDHLTPESGASSFRSSRNPRSIGDFDGSNDHAGSSPEDLAMIEDHMSAISEEDELELPPLRNGLGNFGSPTSTTIHNSPKYTDGPSSDMPEISASPVIPKSRLREAIYPQDDSPPSSPPEVNRRARESSMGLLDSPMVAPVPEDDESFFRSAYDDDSFLDDFEDSYAPDLPDLPDLPGPPSRRESAGEQQLRLQISQIIESIPARIKLTNGTSGINLNPPDLQLPRLRKKPSREPVKRSTSGMSTRTATPSFTLSPVKQRTRSKGTYPIRVYHLSRSDNEAPIKLFIRCVGENGERVMVRVGGGWADLSEYLKEYASHHGRRSAGKDKIKVEVRDNTRTPNATANSSPPSRPPTAADDRSSTSPMPTRKSRRSSVNNSLRPKTPVTPGQPMQDTPPSEGSAISRPSSRQSWVEDESSFLGLAGPRAKKIEMSEESKAWVESIKEKVRMASGSDKKPAEKKFGDIGKAGGTKRVFRRA